MNNLAKVLIGVGVVGVTVAAAVAVKKSKEKRYIEQPVDVAEAGVELRHKDDTILEKIKTAATKKAIRILSWVVIHQKEIEAVSLLLGVVGGIFSVVNAVKEFSLGKKLHAKLAAIDSKLDSVIATHNENAIVYDHNERAMIKCFQIIANKIDEAVTEIKA